jgi:hypothetical protein
MHYKAKRGDHHSADACALEVGTTTTLTPSKGKTMKTLTRVLCGITVILATAILTNISTTVAGALATGGSVLAWYNKTWPGKRWTDSNRKFNLHTWNPPTGTILGYVFPNALTINVQLQQMYSNGQRKFKLIVWHKRDASDTGTVLKSQGGILSATARNNIYNLLGYLKNVQANEVIVEFAPLGFNYVGTNYNPNYWGTPADQLSTGTPDGDTDPCTAGVQTDYNGRSGLWEGPESEWTNCNQSYFDENWGVIKDLYPLTQSVAGLLVKVGLGAEYAPPSYNNTPGCNGPSGPSNSDSCLYDMDPSHFTNPFQDPQWGKRSKYVKLMWSNFVKTFGVGAKQRTIGFSTSGESADNTSRYIRGLYKVYDASGVGRAYLTSVHIYHDSTAEPERAASKYLERTHYTLNAIGEYRQGIIVGEAYYNDSETGPSLSTEQSSIQRPIFFLLQWPISTPSSGLPDWDTGPTINYGNYLAYGY